MSVNPTYSRLHSDEAAALAHLESLVWPDGPVCPNCGGLNQATLLKGGKTRPRLWQCNVGGCRLQFRVTVGSGFEDSKVPMHKWIAAVEAMLAGQSIRQMGFDLGLGSYRTAWHVGTKIKKALEPEPDSICEPAPAPMIDGYGS